MSRFLFLLLPFCWLLYPYAGSARPMPSPSAAGSNSSENSGCATSSSLNANNSLGVPFVRPIGADPCPGENNRPLNSCSAILLQRLAGQNHFPTLGAQRFSAIALLVSDGHSASASPSPCFVNADFTYALDHCSGQLTATGTAIGNGFLTFSWQQNAAIGPTYATNLLPGPNTICLTVTNLTADGTTCQDTVCQTVQWPVNGPMTVTVVGQGTCGQQNLTAVATGGAAPYSFVWNNGAATDTNLVTSSGTYCVTVTDANNCTVSTCQTISVGIPAPIYFDQAPAGNCSVRILSLLWGFGSKPGTYAWSNGGAQHFTTVSTSGTYCLTFTDLDGCSSSACTSVTVPTPPTVAFTSAVNTPTNCLHLNYTSTVSGGTGPYTYAWSLVGSAQGSSPSANPTNIAYGATGIYPVCVTVTDVLGCTATACQQIHVGEICNLNNVDFCTTVEPSGTTRFRVSVGDVSHNCNGTATIRYSFNGGMTWTNSPTFLASTPGSIIVCVRVTCTVCGQTCSHTCCKNVQINAPCNIPATATLNLSINHSTRVATFTASTLSPAAMDYLWDFNGDGSIDAITTSNVTTNTYTYGTHQACVTIRRSANCTKRICRTVIVEEPCNVTANFSARHCSDNPLTVNFTGLVTNNTSVQWLFGDGNVSFANNPTHTYAAAGAYTVELTAYKPNSNCMMRATYTVIVATKNCGGNNVPPTNLVVNDNGEETAEEVDNILLETDGTDQTTSVTVIDGLSLFPNPANELTQLVFELDQAQEVQVTVLDIHGKAYENLQSSATIGQNAITIPTDRLGQGIFLVRLHASGTVRTTKLIIQR